MNWFANILNRITGWLDESRPSITPEKVEMAPVLAPELTAAQSLMLSFYGTGGAPLRDPKAPHAYRPTPPRASSRTNTRPIWSNAHGRLIMTSGKLFKGHRP